MLWWEVVLLGRHRTHRGSITLFEWIYIRCVYAFSILMYIECGQESKKKHITKWRRINEKLHISVLMVCNNDDSKYYCYYVHIYRKHTLSDTYIYDDGDSNSIWKKGIIYIWICGGRQTAKPNQKNVYSWNDWVCVRLFEFSIYYTYRTMKKEKSPLTFSTGSAANIAINQTWKENYRVQLTERQVNIIVIMMIHGRIFYSMKSEKNSFFLPCMHAYIYEREVNIYGHVLISGKT